MEGQLATALGGGRGGRPGVGLGPHCGFGFWFIYFIPESHSEIKCLYLRNGDATGPQVGGWRFRRLEQAQCIGKKFEALRTEAAIATGRRVMQPPLSVFH